MLSGGVSAAIFGFIIGVPALRLRGDYLAICTLAFGEIVRHVFKNLPFFGGAKGLNTGLFDRTTLLFVTLVTVLVVLAIVQNLIRSKHGRAITAIRDNEIAARAMGVNVTYYKLLVFVLSAFAAGLSGVLYGKAVGIIRQDNFSYNYSIEILVMVVLGGMGSMTGAVIAATVLTALPNLMQALSTYRMLIYSLLLIIVMIFKPSGLMGHRDFSLTRLVNRLLRGRGGKEATDRE
jgi:branched-chain amino acid transport system permease protein